MPRRRTTIRIDGKVLRIWRGKRGLREVAAAIGVDHRQLQNLESGLAPSFETGFRLAEYYGTGIGELFVPVWPAGEKRRLRAARRLAEGR